MTIQEGKDRLGISTLAAQLFPDWQPKPSCKRPWGEDKHASFWVFDNDRRWKDHATGEHGDAVDFLARALSLSPEDAIKRFIELAGGSHPSPAPNARKPFEKLRPLADLDTAAKKAKRAGWPPLVVPTVADQEALAILRNLPRAGIFQATVNGILCAAQMGLHRCWIVKSACGRNAQARRLDGRPFEFCGENLKAKTLPGSIARLPVGNFSDTRWPYVTVLEGGPDVLSAYAALHQLNLQDTVAVLGLLGASMQIPAAALATLKDRRARIIQHNDPAGERAADLWAQQIHDAGGKVDIWAPDLECGDLNDVFRLPTEARVEALTEAFDYAKGGC